jgi:beta-glucosidase
MDPYEDPRRPTAERVADLLDRMTLAEKAGQMFQTPIAIGEGGRLVEELAPGFSQRTTTDLVVERHMRHFNVMRAPDATEAACWHNRLQGLAEQTRLGIPVTVSTDPRHADRNNPAASFASSDMSRWPEAAGLAAIGDPDVVHEFADIARREYLAVGIRAALHPQIDLATEPRWARQAATFGADADLTIELLRAYLDGFQGKQIGPDSVACMTKHFPGAGPQKDGEDAHFDYGREQVYPGGNFDEHLRPFIAAIEAGTSALMPYYGMPIGVRRNGVDIEEVGFAFNRQIITDLLRDELGFNGVVCTDWSLVHDKEAFGMQMTAKAWGVEHLSVKDRLLRLIEAGSDQLGGEHCTDLLIELVEDDLVSGERIDESVARLLAVKFDLGLFDDPYVDPEAVSSVVGRDAFVKAGLAAQRRSATLLTDRDPMLPLARGQKLFVDGIDAEAAGAYGDVVDRPEDADVAIARVDAPFEPRDAELLDAVFHQGTLVFANEEVERLAAIAASVPLVVDVRLDRAAVVTPLIEHACALVGTYGTNDRALLDVLFGEESPQGQLPFELPSSMEAVLASRSDVPNDTEEPAFPAGHGLGYDEG